MHVAFVALAFLDSNCLNGYRLIAKKSMNDISTDVRVHVREESCSVHAKLEEMCNLLRAVVLKVKFTCHVMCCYSIPGGGRGRFFLQLLERKKYLSFV